MKEELLKLKLPKNYEKDLFKYQEGLDNVPDFIELIGKGYSKDQYEKLNILVDVERMKYELQEDAEELSDEDMEYIKELIEKRIEEYNAI